MSVFNGPFVAHGRYCLSAFPIDHGVARHPKRETGGKRSVNFGRELSA